MACTWLSAAWRVWLLTPRFCLSQALQFVCYHYRFHHSLNCRAVLLADDASCLGILPLANLASHFPTSGVLSQADTAKHVWMVYVLLWRTPYSLYPHSRWSIQVRAPPPWQPQEEKSLPRQLYLLEIPHPRGCRTHPSTPRSPVPLIHH